MAQLARVFNIRASGEFDSEAQRADKDAQTQREMTATAAWFALHAIPPEKRDSLGIDLTKAPRGSVRPLVTIPVQTEIQQVSLRGDKRGETLARGYSNRAFAEALTDITGQNVKAAGEMHNSVYVEKVLPGNFKGTLVLMDQALDKRADLQEEAIRVRRAIPNAGIVIEAVKQVQAAHEESVRTQGSKYLSVKRIPAVAEVVPLGMVDTDEAFMNFFNSEPVLKALKTPEARALMEVAPPTPVMRPGR